LKCKAAPTPAEPEFSHSIKLKNYNDLRDPTIQVPRILVVVLVPDAPGDWLALRRCGYWLSLRGLPPSANAASQTVTMKKQQTFNVQSLGDIMGRLASGGLP
jgi:hypothetical protein